ncbi:poly-beta-1,6-N-acetyl-D-glucosamine synthase [Acinetobacter shaoyimingii]|uniref:Poly-beta-1,6-N-acetyl-D-glucosamine synthase n=1 Tax=Acinetobacter shaoyimingii TaxID=2715164 RepID=A0A6G8RWH6_9GAMM|nr:poly-beta-1,6-N-acetyl-D-glucosamine synthase [Acinetobacter shaoyimingii]NHB57151.1 poly-beta-1,6 N-acetyl-D-glucosamine synthase [Acinetobacter shaoyimingii]QIO06237.1 poly-beta-1,6 N-acetyl-D-glucosamine synthase [Acinetobacter shaoyimingii]
MTVIEFLFFFAFLYPLVMAWTWMIGGVWFFIKYEFKAEKLPEPPSQGCSIIIPCFNEQDQVRSTIRYALQTQYPNFEVIAVNDGSSDRTAEILDELAEKYEKLRVVHLATNQGKAFALRSGAMLSQYEYLICIDGDALLHPHAALWMMHHLTQFAHVGAVTGNPRILNRSSILGKLQVGEFSSIIGLIKRAQRTYGRIFTVSGVIAGFRKTALEQVGFWSEEKITEDIDISWKIQMQGWNIHYVPKALCYIFMPETFTGLWKQRVRWAQGGVEVLITYIPKMLNFKYLRMWPVVLEAGISVIWSYLILMIIVLFFAGFVIDFPHEWQIKSLMPQWYGVILAVTCLIQFFISLYIDKRYDDQRFFRNYFWVIWYPLFFWLLSVATTVVAVPKAFFNRNKRARWVSPDRGFRGEDE